MGFATGLVKYFVFFANLVFALAGLALIIIGILFKFNINEVTRALPSDFNLAPILSIIIGAIVFITAFLGCCGAVKESTCMLTTYAIVLLTIFIVQVAIGVYAFLQINDKVKFKAAIRDGFQTTFNNRDYNRESNETVQLVQKYLQCCGSNGPEDYTLSTNKLPATCCSNTNAQECPGVNNYVHSEGCSLKLYEKILSSSKIIGGVAIGIAVVEIVGAIFGLCLASSIRNNYRRYPYA